MITRKWLRKSLLGTFFVLMLVAIPLTSAFASPALQDDDGGERQNPTCTGEAESEHPMLAAVAEQYGASYDEVADLFCGGYGLGEIMLAFETTHLVDGETAGALLGKKGKGNGWGRVWQELGLIGRPEDAGPPPHAQNNKNNQNKPEDAGPPDDPGKPDNQGPPDDKGKPDNPGNSGDNPDGDEDPGENGDE